MIVVVLKCRQTKCKSNKPKENSRWFRGELDIGSRTFTKLGDVDEPGGISP